MKPYISPEMQSFLKPRSNEEAVDQPLYHLQAYATTGATQFTFFNTSAGGYSVTNMDAANVLSKGKRFGVFGLGVGFISNADPVQNAAGVAAASAASDAKAVLEGSAWLEFKVLDKTYLLEAPLTRLPCGVGLFASMGGIQQNLAVAADNISQMSYATNGLPVFGSTRKLRVPIPLPEQVRFSVTVNYPTAVPVTTAGTLAIWLDGLLVRAVQ